MDLVKLAQEQLVLHSKSSEVYINIENKVTSSLAAIQREGHWEDNCKMVYYT